MSNKTNDEIRDNILDDSEILYVVSSFVDGKMVYSDKSESALEAAVCLDIAQRTVEQELEYTFRKVIHG